MKIEVKAYYPLKDFALPYDTGTLHVYLVEENIHLRGVAVMFRKNRWYVWIPTRHGYDEKTKKMVRYPLFNFDDREKNKEMVTLLKKEAIAFIKKNFIDKQVA